MTSAIIAAEANCALGTDLVSCVSNLRNSKVNVSTISLDHVEDPVHAPYFMVANPDELAAHELMYQLLEQLVERVLASSGLSAEQLQRTGLYFGSTSFTVSDSEFRYFTSWSTFKQGDSDGQDEESDEALVMPVVGYNKFPTLLAKKFGLGGGVFSYATACTSSANAIIYADKMIERGDIDHALVLGSEFENATTLLGFHGLELLSPTAKMMPFDSSRDGLILGEACAAVVLSNSPDIKALARFSGGACATDTYSLTAANTDGSSIAKVIDMALNTAGCLRSDVVAIKSHGTASLLNDEAEAAGLLLSYKGAKLPFVFALKPYVGHTLGACGMVELALLIGCLNEGFIPANPGVAERGDYGVRLQQTIRKASPGYYLLNYFAFGGNNVSLLIEKDTL